MSILTNDSEYIKRVEQIIDMGRRSGDSGLQKFICKLKADMKDEARMIICPKELYCRCAVTLYEGGLVPTAKCVEKLAYAQQIYTIIFPFGTETPDFEELTDVFLRMLGMNGSIIKGNFTLMVYNLFSNKQNYVKWMQTVNSFGKYTNVMGVCRDYGIEARSYFPSEEAFTANFIFACMRIIGAANPAEEYRIQIRNVEHMAGVYDVDESLIMEAEQSIASARETIDRSRDLLTLMEEKTKSVQYLTEHSVERIKQVTVSELEQAEAKLGTVEARLQEAYDKFVDTQRDRVLADKKQLVDEIKADTEEIFKKFKLEVQQVISMAKLDLAKVNQESGRTIARIENIVREDSKVKELLNAESEQAQLMKKLDRLVLLNDRNIDLLEGRIAKEAALEQEGGKTEIVMKASDSADEARTAIMVADDCDSEEIPPVNPLLDESIDFQKRYELVMKEKAKMEKNGEHFHRMFDDVLTAVMENANPYLIGPSGCGKTYMVGQISRMLGIEFTDIGYINEEYDILGFQTANGGYSKPNFYRCYKYGRIAFCDELDNGNSRATVKLNSFLSNTKNAGYSFPHGEHVKRHPNFRIIAAGNTAGNGADGAYNTREKIEESVQQRFTPIYIGYDNEVERAILKDYTNWYEFIVLFRAATNEWSRKSHSVAPGIITTRDAARIRKYVKNGSFSMEKIVDYEFIQTKDESYLAFLSDYIDKNLGKNNPAAAIAKCFIDKVEQIRACDNRV